MCRWLVYFGNEEVLLADLVTRPKNSIVQQSFADPYLPFITCEKGRLNHKVNGDGFGLGWYGDVGNGVPCVFTSTKPSWNDRNLNRLAEHIKSKCVFAHVRAASPKSLIVENNCHPFMFGRILFMHNGTIAHFQNIKRKLVCALSEECFSLIEGSTDTEHAGALFVNYLPNRDPHALHSAETMKEALLKTIKHLIQLTREASDTPQASSLNFAVTNGEVTITTRYRNSEDEDPPSLYYTKRQSYNSGCCAGFSKDSNRSVVISSEPLTYEEDEWALVPKNYMMTVTKSHHVVLEPIDIENEELIAIHSSKEDGKFIPSAGSIITCPSPRLTRLLSSPKNNKISKIEKELSIRLRCNKDMLILIAIFVVYLYVWKL